MKNKISTLLFTMLLLCAFTANSQLKLNSYPSATATIYLDFDGEQVNSPVWNYGNALNCAASGLSTAQITEVFNRVAEDFRPFNINITTDADIYFTAPADKRIRVIITPTSNWFNGVGGVGYLGSFTWGDDTPCFVFSNRLGPNSPKMIAECCSHESGHSLGLSHQSKYDAVCNLTATYNEGNGTGECAWAPIMGNSYYRNMSGWNNGPTPYGCSSSQDNLSIITSQNGFGFRADDYGDDIQFNATNINPAAINIDGLINTSSDKDAFTFNLSQPANFRLNANPFSVLPNNEGADLDIKISLFDADKNLISVYDPSNSMSVLIDTILKEGNYYFIVEGAGNNNTSNYGSLGSYNITGVMSVLPIRSITLTGKADKNKHNLNWNIAANEAIRSVTIQSTTNGNGFTDISLLDGITNNFSYPTYQTNEIQYRLKVTSISGQEMYSNTISLKNNPALNNFIVSTFAINTISIQSNTNYQFTLFDVNGYPVTKGTGSTGFNKIEIGNQASGIYLLQLFYNNQQQTIKILKQ